MKKPELYLGTALAALVATPALAQDEAEAPAMAENVIIVTAQRQAQSLQEVPIAVSAFSAEALEAQQIENASDLQLTLPNVSFTKSNFTSASFTIRGIGDLCVGATCDSATAIHTNGSPLFNTRLFETEYFDLERIEVLRGPQGTLFGRNATSGVVNVVTAKPDLSGFGASADFEYGNFNSIKGKAMLNLPIGETIGVRLAGFYLNRDGYTKNLFDGSKIDDRDMYAVRGSLRFEPGPATTIDLMAYYFREKDSRMRLQKQLCQRDPTGVLGCLNARRDFANTNANSTFTGTLGSEEFMQLYGLTGFGLNSIYGQDSYSGYTEPNDVRTVTTAYDPQYFADELQFQAHLDQGLGAMNLSLTGIYQETEVNSSQDYNLGIAGRNDPQFISALNQLAIYSNPALVGAGVAAYFSPIANALIPGGPTGQLCTSNNIAGNLGSFEGYSVCGDVPLAFDRSNLKNRSWSTEAILTSDFDGPFNFLLGGIYADSRTKDNDYYVNTFAIDYIAGVIGAGTALSAGFPPSYLGTSFYRNNAHDFRLKSYGIFGEVYFDISDRLKFTAGLRYNSDKKKFIARTTLADFLVPIGTDDPFNTPFGAGYDADPFTDPDPALNITVPAPAQVTCDDILPIGAIGSVAGCEAYSVRNVSFHRLTGRAVLDFQITPDNLVYASYSRGYKSGGINPPLTPVFAVPEGFGPETIDAFEIGTKNTFADGALQVNATAFYYKYKDLQLSRIIARTSVNDTIDAKIWGVELETILRPAANWLVNMNFSYLNAEVAGDQYFSNPRDPGGGDSNAVIIKDITNGANCAVTGAAPGGPDAFVNFVNSQINSGAVPGLAAPTTNPLQGTTEFPSDANLASSAAFSICEALDGYAQAAGALFGGIDVLSPGVQVNIKGNKLPQAPTMKASLGVQYMHEFPSGMTVVPRFDLALTGEQYGNVFNGTVNRIEPFVQANAQIQFNSADERWFVRGFVQNIFDSNSVTGLYVTDASSGLFTNIFTLDPRRYGLAVGVKF